MSGELTASDLASMLMQCRKSIADLKDEEALLSAALLSALRQDGLLALEYAPGLGEVVEPSVTKVHLAESFTLDDAKKVCAAFVQSEPKLIPAEVSRWIKAQIKAGKSIPACFTYEEGHLAKPATKAQVAEMRNAIPEEETFLSTSSRL